MASRGAVWLGAVGAACALVSAIAMWGFTVDDALIAVRYAHDVAIGAGYRFHPASPPTDGVTPLPWTFLLVPFASGDALSTLTAAKVIGTAAWTIAAAFLGVHLARAMRENDVTGMDAWPAPAALAVMGLAFPIGAWAASGMETGLATALATLATTRLRAPRTAAAIAGIAAAFRPEMVVWAVALAAGAATAAAGREEAAAAREVLAKRIGIACAIAAAPFATCAVLRLMVFGRAAPLALLAKPSDVAHGAVYAGAAVLVVLLPLFAFAPFAVVRAGGGARAIAIAFVAHVVAVIMAGGDWMPYARLLVPVAPSLAVLIVLVAPHVKRPWGHVRALAALVLGVLLAARAAPAGRNVDGDRRDLIARARPVLAASHVVAALDIGWVSAATDARIVDLAGLTDPAIAALPGGHTSKRVDLTMLLDRDVDTLLVYLDPRGDMRVVEARIVRTSLFEERYEEVTRLPLGNAGARYVVFRRR